MIHVTGAIGSKHDHAFAALRAQAIAEAIAGGDRWAEQGIYTRLRAEYLASLVRAERPEARAARCVLRALQAAGRDFFCVDPDAFAPELSALKGAIVVARATEAEATR